MPTSRIFLPTFQTFCLVGVHFAQTVVHLPTFQFRPGKGVFWGGFGNVLYTYIAPKGVGVGGGILGNWDPIWAKWDPSAQFVRKVGKSALELGKKNSIIFMCKLWQWSKHERYSCSCANCTNCLTYQADCLKYQAVAKTALNSDKLGTDYLWLASSSYSSLCSMKYVQWRRLPALKHWELKSSCKSLICSDAVLYIWIWSTTCFSCAWCGCSLFCVHAMHCVTDLDNLSYHVICSKVETSGHPLNWSLTVTWILIFSRIDGTGYAGLYWLCWLRA